MYTASAWTDWVSKHIHANGTWEEEETRGILGRLNAFAEVRRGSPASMAGCRFAGSQEGRPAA